MKHRNLQTSSGKIEASLLGSALEDLWLWLELYSSYSAALSLLFSNVLKRPTSLCWNTPRKIVQKSLKLRANSCKRGHLQNGTEILMRLEMMKFMMLYTQAF